MKNAINHFLLFILVISITGNAADAKLIACIGDSITYGANITDPATNGYPAQLQSMLQKFDSAWQTRNFGVSGATLLKKGDLPYVNQNAYSLALASKPDVVVIMLGTNDSKSYNWVYKADFVTDYLSLIDSFAKLSSKPVIWICKPVPAFSSAYSINNTIIRDEVVPLIDEIAKQRNVKVMDLYTSFLDKSSLLPDGIHPNVEGAGLIAQIVSWHILGVRVLPDFDNNARVDLEDFARLAKFWMKSEFSYDIAPAPNGDGIVDYKDLAGLAQYWLQEFNLFACWKFDEAEGSIAHESINSKDATVKGNPVWLPVGGTAGGSLSLDGNDYVITPFILNPGTKKFSIFAWVKGGGSSQVIISQEAGMNWLATDAQGNLIMELKGGRKPASLLSQKIITDSNWHHIGFTWDGLNRILYVDDVRVALDTQSNLTSSDGKLHFGAGYNLNPGTFWIGLIDDIRIYDKAITP